jgi:HD-like signal output (HDOD) protein
MHQATVQEAVRSWRSTPQQTYQNLIAELNREVAAGAYRVPPKHAIDALLLCRDVAVHAERIDALVADDDALRGRTVWLAGTALYGEAGAFRSVRAIVEQLGPPLAREILGHAVMSLYACDAAHFPTWRGQICAQSAGVGYACAALARAADRGGEWAFCAGVLHDIGKAVLIQIMSRLPAGLSAPGEMARHLLEAEHARVGRTVAAQQRWPGALCCAIGDHHDYDPRSHDDEPAALVGLARRVWKTSSGRGSPEEERWPEVTELRLSDYDVRRTIEQVVSLKPRWLTLGGYLEEETVEALAS